MLNQVMLFPFHEYWWFYAGFTAFVLVLLLLDLGVFHRQAHEVSFKEAVGWSVFWISLSLAFDYGFYRYMLQHFPHDARLMAIPGFDPGAAAQQGALEFLAGYVVEYSLSVDNLFVFIVVMGFFAIPKQYQHRVLFFGILGALIFRGLFIAAGALLMRFQWVVWLFGAILVITGVRMMFANDDGVAPEENAVIRLFRKYVPVTPTFHGARFFLSLNGRLHATPLLVALLFLEMTDIVFAVDSVPAIFALTREPLVVFTSNIFAILGLRSLYFMLAGAMSAFHFLKYGLGVVLIFVGLKMTVLHQKVSIGQSLSVIIGVIAVSIILSLLFPPPPESPSSEEKS